MTTVSDELQKALDTHDKVTVFCQNLRDIRSFVLDKPGRWWLKFNPIFWRKVELKSNSIAEGRSVSGYKVGVTWDESLPEVGTICETSGEPRVYVTQIPTAQIFGSFIIKSQFIMPFFGDKRHPGNQIIFCGDSQSYLNCCEQLDLHGSEYSTGYSIERKPLHVQTRIAPEQSDVAVIKYMPSIEEVSLLHGLSHAVKAYANPKLDEITYKNSKSVLQCFQESPGSMLGIPYIATKTFMHPKDIRIVLDFLTKIKCLEQPLVDTGKVVIHKDAQGIIKGEYSAKLACKILNLQRVDLCRYLKSKNILSSYYPSQKEYFWRYRSNILETKFNELLKLFRQQHELLMPIIDNGDIELNKFINKRIEAECLLNRKHAIIIEGGAASHINPTPTIL